MHTYLREAGLASSGILQGFGGTTEIIGRGLGSSLTSPSWVLCSQFLTATLDR
jgi:hypothetical protein